VIAIVTPALTVLLVVVLVLAVVIGYGGRS